MRPPIVLPSTLPEGSLYRVTYEGPSTKWHYAYDLQTSKKGYDCHVSLRVDSGRAVKHITRSSLRDVLIETTRAMHDITNENSAWERDHLPDEKAITLSMRITRAQRDPFGLVASRILHALPRLQSAEITAYYR